MNTLAFDQIINAGAAGDPARLDEACTLLYRELKRLAHAKLRASGQATELNTTGLVHECWLRLQRQPGLAADDVDRFMAYCASTMRSVLVDRARARLSERRGGGSHHTVIEESELPASANDDEQLLQVHEALHQLSGHAPRLAEVVTLRYFGGLSDDEVAACMGVTRRTVLRDWAKARLYLAGALA